MGFKNSGIEKEPMIVKIIEGNEVKFEISEGTKWVRLKKGYSFKKNGKKYIVKNVKKRSYKLKQIKE